MSTRWHGHSTVHLIIFTQSCLVLSCPVLYLTMFDQVHPKVGGEEGNEAVTCCPRLLRKAVGKKNLFKYWLELPKQTRMA